MNTRTRTWPVIGVALLLALGLGLGWGWVAQAAQPATVPTAETSLAGEPATGLSYKMRVEADGIYRLTYADLQAAGLPVDALDPRTLKVWEQGEEIAIYVQGEDDGSFDPGDALYFYGKMARTRYQDPNIYWLTYGGPAGKRMALRDVTPGSAPAAPPYPRTVHLEEDRIYRSALPMEPNADHWFWESYFACSGLYCIRDDTKTYTVTLPNLASGPYTATLRLALQGVSEAAANPDHHVEIYVNGTKVGDAYWDGENAFVGEFTFPQSLLTVGPNQIRYYAPLDLPGVTEDRGFTNWIELTYYDVYEAEGDALDFRIAAAGTWRVNVTGFTSADVLLLDISDPRQPVRLTGATVTPSGSTYTLAFQDNVPSGGRAYVAAGESAFLTPAAIWRDEPSDLKNPNNAADWIAITHRDFLTPTLLLAAHRASFSGLRTMVVDVQDVYDEFSGGLMDPEAIRQFLAYARDNWQRPAPQYVVLVGDGNYDYKDNLVHEEKQFIPPYLDLVDCFLGETAADNRFVAGPRTNSNPNALECQKHAMPYMAIGRLPVNTVAEAMSVVTRIVCYEDPTNALCEGLPPAPAGWEQRALFVADKNDNAGAFTCHSDEVAGQQRCPDQDFGFRPVSPRRPSTIADARNVKPGASLAVVGPQVTNRAGFIGDFIWLDSDGDGWPDPDEPGINGVVVNLWEDVDHDGTLSPPDVKVATVISGDNPATPETEQGWYGFDGLDKTNYLVEIDPVNFEPGGALEGTVLSAGQNPWPVEMDGLIPDEYTRIKVYLEDEAAPGVIPYPSGNEGKSAVVNAINNGVAFVTYNGHATTFRWSGSGLLDIYTVPNLTNVSAWPVFLPMTCLESQFQSLYIPSLGETLLRATDAQGRPIGAVAVWGPTGLGVATGHSYLFQGFFEAVFKHNITTIGDAILFAKRRLYESDSIFKDLIETYTLLGDPAMRLRVPRPDLRVSQTVTPAGTVTPGTVLTYTITVENAGPLTAWDVRITDTLPSALVPLGWSSDNATLRWRPGTTYAWEMAELPVGGRVRITVTARVADDTPGGALLLNRVTVASGTGDSNPANNVALVENDVGGLYAVQGRTYVDSNASRTFDPGESPLANIVLTLLDSTNTPVASTQSDATGVYTFTALAPGTYTVRVTTPAGYVPTTPTEREVTVVDASVLNVDFGFISPTAVTVVALEAKAGDETVVVRWAVRDETGIVGYRVYRSRSLTDPRQPVTPDLIPAQGQKGTVWYRVEDRPPAGGVWHYWVAAFTGDGFTTWVGPATVRVDVSSVRQYIPHVWH